MLVTYRKIARLLPSEARDAQREKNQVMRFGVAACLLALLLTGIAGAENAAILRGTVSSAHSGRPIAGALVTIESGSVFFTTKADRRGFFSMMGLPPGPARLQVQAPGYMSVMFDICVQAGVTRSLPLVLGRAAAFRK